jgi:hypothetical protein
VQNNIVHCLDELVQPLTRCFLPAANASNMQPDAIFVHFPNAFGVVDAPLIFIQKSQSNQNDYDSGKCKTDCMKI